MTIELNYHDRPELSSTQVATFLEDPIYWYHVFQSKDWPKDDPTPAMIRGTQLHSMIECGGPDKMPFVERPAGCDLRKTEWKQWKAQVESEGKEVVDSLRDFRITWGHLQANNWCKEVIDHAAKEVAHVWHDPDIGPCRVKFDAVLGGTIVDWKTTSKTCARTFAADAFSRFYDVRLALYRRGHRDLFGTDPEVVIVAIETSGGLRVTPYRMPVDWLEEAEARLILAVDDMRHFDLSRFLNQEPVDLEKPRYATFNFEEVS